MKTKLEMMVGYLAGRQGDAAASIRRELEDPTSEASRWLEAVRSRSRGVVGAAALEQPDPVSPPAVRDRATAPGMAGRRLARLLFGAAAAALALIAAGAAWRARDDRLGHLEATLARREARWGDRFRRLEAALARREAPPRRPAPRAKGPSSPAVEPTPPADGLTRLALARIEARLGELGQRIGEGQPSPDPGDQRVAQLGRDLTRLRQEVELAARSSRQESQELSGAVREILHLLRRLALQAREPEPMPVPVPIPVPSQGHEPGAGPGPSLIPGPGQVSGPAQMPGQNYPHNMAPGRGNR
jgi:hypothetical protein